MSAASICRCVVHHHSIGEQTPELDPFDLMIEDAERPDDTRLATWRLSRWPIERLQAATRLANHRAAWLDREGLVSGNRGVARRVFAGQCEVLQCDNSRWRVRLEPTGEVLVLTNESDTGEAVETRWRIATIRE